MLGAEFRNYLRRTGEGRVATEVRHADRGQDWVYLPDLHVTTTARRAAGGPVENAPDFAIEVLSPDDRAGSVLERVEIYLRAGTRLLWVVDPENETITAYRPGEVTRVHRAGALVDAKPVLEAFSLEVAALFAAARDEE